MRSAMPSLSRGFTLIELLAALLILSLMALMSDRGLGAVLDARDHVAAETDKWRRVAAFFARFEQDVHLAAPRTVRTVSGSMPAWHGMAAPTSGPVLEFSRFAAADTEPPLRLGYGLNPRQEIELWLWSGLDLADGALPARYPVLAGVTKFEVRYLNADLAWTGTWPTSPRDRPIPRAVEVRVELASGEAIMRMFALSL